MDYILCTINVELNDITARLEDVGNHLRYIFFLITREFVFVEERFGRMMKKTCNRCKNEKTLDKFSKHPKGKYGKHPTCNDCRNKQHRIYYANNKEHIKQLPSRLNRNYRISDLKRKFGITFEQFELLVILQNGLCAICRKKLDKHLAVDHDHKTGEIRGLLCTNCNVGLGHFRDSGELLQRAIDYLVGWPSQV